MSLFTSFNSGVSGLKASQAGMNTAAHNLANTKTTGYTRQQNILRDTYYSNIKVTSHGRSRLVMELRLHRFDRSAIFSWIRNIVWK